MAEILAYCKVSLFALITSDFVRKNRTTLIQQIVCVLPSRFSLGIITSVILLNGLVKVVKVILATAKSLSLLCRRQEVKATRHAN